jgi:hypothetical protein
MLEMVVMLLLAVPLEDPGVEPEGMEGRLTPVCPPVLPNMKAADWVGKGGQANGGSVNEVNNGYVKPLARRDPTEKGVVLINRLLNINALNLGSGNAGSGGDASSGNALGGGAGCHY